MATERKRKIYVLTSSETCGSESSAVDIEGWVGRLAARFSGQNLWADFVLPLLAFGLTSGVAAPAESNIGCRIRRRPFINLHQFIIHQYLLHCKLEHHSKQFLKVMSHVYYCSAEQSTKSVCLLVGLFLYQACPNHLIPAKKSGMITNHRQQKVFTRKRLNDAG